MIHKTVETVSIAELEEKRSRFIAHLVPYKSFDKTLEELRQKHRKANHHVTALRWFDENGQVLEFAKDDGEPSGTSGMPVLKTLIGADLVEVGIIVTRYFGGVKLGTGGLARAYSGAASKVIADADLVDWKRLGKRTFEIGYDEISGAEQKIAQSGFDVLSRNYTDTGMQIVVAGKEPEIWELDLDRFQG